MKKMLNVVFVLLTFTFCLQAQVTVMGELTGAGGKYKIQKLVGLIHRADVLEREEIDQFLWQGPKKKSEDYKVSDIASVVVHGETISALEIEGFIVEP